MKALRIAALIALASTMSLPCFAEGRGVSAQASSAVIGQDPLTRQIILSLTKPNGGVRSFTATANDKTIELVPAGPEALQPLKPVGGLVQPEEVKAPAKTKAVKAMPQLQSVAAKKASL